MKRALLLSIVLLVVTGCGLHAKPHFKKQYTLTDSRESVTPPPAETPPRRPLTLRIARVGAPQWLDTRNFYYQLAYATVPRLAAYGRSEWIAPPPLLLQRLWQNTIASAHEWRAVIGPGDNAQADLTLRLSLLDFRQVFHAPQQSTCVVSTRATLVDERDEKVLDQRDFRVDVPAPSPDAEGGARGLDRASHDLGGQIRKWLAEDVRLPPTAPPPAP